MDPAHSHLTHNDFQRAYYAGKTRNTIAHTESPYIQRHLNEVLRVARVRPGAAILDAGCGMGRHSVLLQRRGYAVEGLELSPVLLQRMAEQTNGAIPTHCADLADPPAELTGRYEAILGFFILHHLQDLPAAMKGVARMLRPGGRMAFIEPNPYNPLYSVQITCTPGMKWRAEKGIFQMRRSTLFPAMESAGMKSLDLFRFGFLPPFLRNTSWGGPFDAALERVPGLEPLLSFQIFSASKPDA